MNLHGQSEFKPNEPKEKIQTVSGLKAWMIENQCNFLSIGIGSQPYEGYMLESGKDGKFSWIYTERGIKHVQRRFDTEAEAADFAFKQLKDDPIDWRQMIGFLKRKRELAVLLLALDERGIFYFQDVIPYGGPGDPRYRVFVNGLDASSVADLKSKYGEELKF